VITIFSREGIKDIEFIEVAMCLSPVVEKPVYRHLLKLLCDQIEQATALDYRHLECLAQLIRGASAGYLETADLLKIFELIVDGRADIHQTYLGLSVAELVDAITESCAEGLDHEELSRSISVYLDGLRSTSVPQQVYQAAYIYQALQHIPDDKPIWYTAQQQLQKANGLKDSAKAIDVKEILQQLQDVDKRSECLSKKGSQGVSGGSLLDYLNDGGSFECKQSWYPAIRTANALLRSGQFTEFKKLAYEASCRRNPAFQCGLCQLLFECLAANIGWDTYTRMNAVEFLEDIFWNDAVWGQQADIKELIISFLTMLSTLQEGVKQGMSRYQVVGVCSYFRGRFIVTNCCTICNVHG
jgi:hypothetical protein